MRKLPDYIKNKADKWNNECIERGSNKFIPLEIEIIFKIGRNGNSFLSFESIINHFTFLYIFKELYYYLSIHFDEVIILKIPIKKQFFGNDKDDYFYLCGGFFDIPNKVAFLTKKTQHPVIPIIKDRRVRVAAGSMKNYKLPVLYSTNKIYKFGVLGDYELIKKILPSEINIGKKHAIGYGQCEITIKEAKEFNLFKNNKYIRPVPKQFILENKMKLTDNEIFTPVRPPYFGIQSKSYECCL